MIRPRSRQAPSPGIPPSQFRRSGYYLSKVRGTPRGRPLKYAGPLTPEQQAICTKHIPLAVWIVNKFFSRVSQQIREELHAVAGLALVTAVLRFRSDNGAMFSTYATKCIRGECTKFWQTKIAQDQIVVDEISPDQEPIVLPLEDKVLDRIEVARFLQVLTPREKEVVIYSYGLNNYPALNDREIGEILGCSSANVQQSRSRAIRRIKVHCLIS